MPDREETPLPVPIWTDVLQQLALPFQAYQQQLMRTYEPALLIAEQVLQAYGGWMRSWERLVYWERFESITRSALDVSEWGVEERTPAFPMTTTATEPRPHSALRESDFAGRLPELGNAIASDDPAGDVQMSSPAQAERVLADLAYALETVSTHLEHVTSSLASMLDEQLKLLASLAALRRQGTSDAEEQAHG